MRLLVDYSFTRTSNPTPPPEDDFNAWTTKTIEDRPDGSVRTVYTNFAGQTILRVLTARPPGIDTDQNWAWWYKYDGAGRVLQEANPSAIASYDEAKPDLATLKENDGFVRVHEYYPATDFGVGGAPNYRRYEMVQQGSAGAAIKIREWKYVSRQVSLDSVYKPSAEILYQSEVDGGSDPATIQYAYAWQRFAVTRKTTTWPVVAESQNGSGIADSMVEAYYLYGRLTWKKDERGYIDGYSYDPATDAVIQQIRDVSGGAPWPVLPGDHLNLVTDYEVDDQGRTVQELGPVHQIDLAGTATDIRRATWTVYQDDIFQEWTGMGYREQASGNYTLINPVKITARDELGRTTDEIQAIRASTAGRLAATDSFPQSTWCRWKHDDYTNSAQVGASRVYYAIPTSGEGTENEHYNESRYAYDILQRRVREETPGGTIVRFINHPLGWVLSRWIGTDDAGATDLDPAGGGAEGNNMVLMETNIYDGGAGGGDGRLTGIIQQVNATETRVTSYEVDFRGRRTAIDGELDFWQGATYDNLGRILVSVSASAS